MSGLSVILPAYHEHENLAVLLPRLKEELQSLNIAYEILVIDTNEISPETVAVCRQEGVSCYCREGSNDYGDALRTGFKYARMEKLLTMDADGSHAPSDIAKLWAKAQDADLVIGSRYCAGGVNHNQQNLKFMSWLLNATYRLLFNLKVADLSNSFRIYDTRLVKSLTLSCRHFDIIEELLVKCKLKKPNFTVVEVPIEFNQRAYGTSKRRLLILIVSYLTTILRLLKVKWFHEV